MMENIEEYEEEQEREEQSSFLQITTLCTTKITEEEEEDRINLTKEKEEEVQEIEEQQEEIEDSFYMMDTTSMIERIEAEYEESKTMHLYLPEYQQVENMQIPDEMPKLRRNHVGNFQLRKKFIDKMGFAYISWRWVYPLVAWLGSRKVLEVMSGKGALAYALREKGVDVIATDDFSWHQKIKWDSLWTDIEDMDALTAIETYGEECDVLIMSWAPYDEPIGYEVLQKYHEVNPNGILLVIGEGEGGCTADDDFFYHFEEIEDPSFDTVIRAYQRWEGLHDYPAIGRYVKKEEDEKKD